jgi:hypothetical protein
MNEWRRPVHC